MNNPRPRAKNQRNRRQRNSQPGDLWRTVGDPPEPQPIVPTAQPSAMIESLGAPPLQSQSDVGAQYFAAVIERAAVLANALATSAGLLADSGQDEA